MVGPTLDNPNVNPDVINPPAHVITYNAEQLEQIRGTALAEGPLGRGDYQFAHAQARGEPPTGAEGHNPFGLERVNQVVDRSTKNTDPVAEPTFKLPPSLQRFVDNQKEAETDKLSHDIYMNKINYDLGIARRDTSQLMHLASLSPERASQTAVKLMDNELFSIPRAGGSLPGLSQSETAQIFRLRDEYRSPSPGTSPEQIAKDRAEYEKLCKDYLVDNVYDTHNALARHAVRGFEPKQTAQELYALNHPDKDPKYAKLTPDERQAKLVDIVANTPSEGFDQVMREYSTIPLRDTAKELYTAIQKGDIDALRQKLGSRSPRECDQLMAITEEYAREHNVPSPTAVVYGYSEQQKRDDFIHLMRGFDAQETARAVYSAYDQKTLGIHDINDAEMARAFGVYKGADGKLATCYTAEQVTQIRENLRGIAAAHAQDKSETERQEFVKEVEAACTGKVEEALKNPRKSALDPLTCNYANDAKAVGLDPDKTVGSISASRAYGYDAAQSALSAHLGLERYDPSKPTAAADAERILNTLRFGSDPERKRHLLVAEELAPLIQAHDGMFVNADRNLSQSLREGIDKKLSGDARVQGLQIIDQGFYADLEASKVAKDLTQLPNITRGASNRQQLLDRIDQVDKEYHRQNGKGLIEAIDESSLPPDQKASLHMIAGLPRAISLREELAKPKADPAVLAAALKTPHIEEIYRATYRPLAPAGPGNLRIDLENAATQGHISRDFVVEQELTLAGIAPDAVAKLNAEVDATNPTIGSKTSLLRGLKTEQLAVVERMYNFAELGRAEARGDAPVMLRDRVFGLMQEGKISEDQAVRAGMSLAGKDVWDIADAIDKNRSTTLSTLANLNDVETAQVRDVYREERGELLLHAIINDSDLEKKFANKGEYVGWIDNVGDRLYGVGIRDFVVQVDLAMEGMRKAQTDEQKQAEMQKLVAGLEWAASAGAAKNVREMYNSYFGNKGENKLKTDLDELATSNVITKEQHEYLIGLLDQK